MKLNPRDLRKRDEQVREAHFQYSQGRITRREFLRFTSALGGGSLAMSLLSPLERFEMRQTKLARRRQAPQRGGTVINASSVDTNRFDDPAKLNLVFPSNYVRQVCDYLVTLDTDLVLQPSLATEWMPSEDGLTWTLKLREGVKFNHGKDFNADDVVFTINRLIDPATASGFAGAASFVTGAEKVDDFTVNIHTNRVAADFIYTLFLYQAAVLPADWPGDFFTNPWGTGPFTIEDFSPTEYVRFKARSDYWKMGEDGSPLPYLDSLEFVTYPDELARISAMQEGSLHLGDINNTALLDQYKALEGYEVVAVQTGNLHIAVMHFNEKPWTDDRVREAFKLSVDRGNYVDTLYLGYAIEADDQPIAPGMYPLAPAGRTPRQQDYEKAKALLAEAGYPDGVDLKTLYIDAASDGGFAEGFAVFMESQAKPAGFRLDLQPTPDYWNIWLNDWGENSLGISNWAQKNSASEMFNLAYKTGAVWNESHWTNAEFDAGLEEFDRTLDQEVRRGQLETLCNLLSDEGSVMIPGFRQNLAAKASALHYKLHPQAYVWMGDAWLEA
jgi:peptide/nickel transport system substrate-binding protein